MEFQFQRFRSIYRESLESLIISPLFADRRAWATCGFSNNNWYDVMSLSLINIDTTFF